MWNYKAETIGLYIFKVGWAFDLFGNMWGVGRNEDGDSSGWGSRTFRTFDGNLSEWLWLSGDEVKFLLYNAL